MVLAYRWNGRPVTLNYVSGKFAEGLFSLVNRKLDQYIDSLEYLKENGEDAWLAMQEKKWLCSCGSNLSWYLKHCLHCGKPSSCYVMLK